MPTVVVVGLGPAGAEYLTAAAARELEAAGRLYLRTARHPGVSGLLANGALALDHHYETALTFEAAYRGIVDELVASAEELGVVHYAVPGSPMVLEHTVELLSADPRVEVRLVAGLSFLDLAWLRLGLDPVSAGVRLVDAERFAEQVVGSNGPVLVTQTWSRGLLSELKLAFEALPDIDVVLLHHLGLPDEQVRTVAFSEIDKTIEPDHLTCCYFSGLGDGVASELLRADQVVRILRVECPWDAEQTHQSLVRHLLEESYEAIESIEALGEEPTPQQIEHLVEELGDVLCQVLFHSAIGAEEGWFNLSDVAGGIADKLVRRHPHVFGDSERPEADQVLGRWEEQKREEKGREGLLEGVPLGLPALALAWKFERRSSAGGVRIEPSERDREHLRRLLDQLLEGEVRDVGELLFSLATRAAASGEDPEAALRKTLARFKERFEAAEAAARAGGEALPELLARDPAALGNRP